MSYEVEMKFRAADHDRVRRWLVERGAREESTVVQVDVYLRHPSRDFAQTHEALRLRRIGAENRVTYKGPRLPGPTKTREEIELSFDGGDAAFDQLARLFENLGFRPVATIRKLRTSFHLARPPHEVVVALDRAEGLGDFAEIEAIARDETELSSTQSAVMELAGELGLDRVEPRSYLRMFLDLSQHG